MNTGLLSAIRVAAILDGVRAPAVRFRFHQLAPHLEALGIELERWCTPDASLSVPAWLPARKAAILANFAVTGLMKLPGVLATRNVDATILSRQLVQGVPFLESVIPEPWILDVDDTLWEARPFGDRAARFAAARASAVVTGNPFLADWYRRFNPLVEVIPTAVDTTRYHPDATRRDDTFTVGWIGSRSNLPFLESREAALAQFLKETPSSKLLVVSDSPPNLPTIDASKLEYRAWSPEIEVGSIQRMHVGLMPLSTTDVARGKSAAKLLTYASCGVPSIASPVGVNADILATADIGWPANSDAEWYAALMQCVRDPSKARDKGMRGRELVIQRYSARRAAESWATLLTRLVPR